MNELDQILDKINKQLDDIVNTIGEINGSLRKTLEAGIKETKQ